MSIYTLDPSTLLVQELILFVRVTLDLWHGSLFSIVWPVLPINSSLDELAPGLCNWWSIVVHIFLLFVQLGYVSFVLIAPILAVPTVLYFAVLVGVLALNVVFCDLLLNDCRGRVFYAGRAFSADWNDEYRKLESRDIAHAGERWVFINGVAAGYVQPCQD
jgi:hypothetical protein